MTHLFDANEAPESIRSDRAAAPGAVQDLIVRSSLGSAGAQALSERTPDHLAAAILAGVAGTRAHRLELAEPLSDIARDDASASSTNSVPTEEVGYRGPMACTAAGITYRQLDYWARTGLVMPSMCAAGSSTQRLYTFKDILVLKIVKRLLDTGVPLDNIWTVVNHLPTRSITALSTITLMSDGRSIYECQTAEEVVDLLASGQGVFGIAISGALRELEASLAELPGEALTQRPPRGQATAIPASTA